MSSILSVQRSGLAGTLSLLSDRRKRWRLILPAIAVIAVGGGLIYYQAARSASQKAQQAVPQTTVARRGDIVLSTSGTGTLQAANQKDLAFGSSGTLAQLNVKVGDQVKQGQLLAQLDNSSQQLQYQQAQQNLDGLTSASAIGAAQTALATATANLQSANLQLQYLISPDVYYWDNQVRQDALALQEAQAAAALSPNDASAQAKVKKAQAVLAYVKDKLQGAQDDYKDYVIETFTVKKYDHAINKEVSQVLWPTDAEITKARQDIVIDQGAVNDAQNLYNALTGGPVPANASGSGLVALQQAKLDLQTAKTNVEATQLVAPFSGTVVAVDAQVGDSVDTSTVITIADMSQIYMQTYVDQSDFSMFKVGNTASIVFDALPEQTFTGKVTQVDPALDTSSGSAVVSGLVQVDPSAANLLIGMTGTVNVIGAQARNVVIVPVAALHEYAPGKYEVYVMRNGKPMATPVEVGLEDPVNAEIKSGLQPGDVVSTGTVAAK